MNQTDLFTPMVGPKTEPIDPKAALECAGNQALLALVDGPLKYAELFDAVFGKHGFRHLRDCPGERDFSWWLRGLEISGRLVITDHYHGSRSPAEGNYRGYTHVYSLPDGSQGART